MQKISDNVYVETGFRGCNTGFVITKEGIVMIDSPQMPGDALRWRDEISKYGEVRYLINTEPHGDHFSGNFFFPGTVVAHEGTREAMLGASIEDLRMRVQTADPESLSLLKDYSFRPPTITLSQRLTIYLGEHTFQLINMPGHTPYQVAVYIPEEKVVFTSDNIFHKVQAFLHQCLPDEWLQSLQQLEELDADVLVPGHGSTCDRSYIPEMRAFIQDWMDTVQAAIDRGVSLEEALETISMLDRYPMESGVEAMGRELQRWNVTRLYEILQE